MIVREAVADDIPAMVELGHSFHEEGPRAALEFDRIGAVALAAQCISESRTCAYVAERDGEIVGMLLGAVQKWPYLKATFATDILFVSRQPWAGKKLLQRFAVWAQGRGCDLLVHAVSYGQRGDRFYERMGFERMGGMFTLELKG